MGLHAAKKCFVRDMDSKGPFEAPLTPPGGDPSSDDSAA